VLIFALGALIGWVTADPRRGEKGQDLRVWDVVALGPWLAILAYQRGPLQNWQRAALLFTAGATITHNGRNFLMRKRASVGQ
jgi:hypothetical protein